MGFVEDVNAASVRLTHEYGIVIDRLATIRAGIVRAREELRGRLGNTQHPHILRAEHLVTLAERQILEAEGALSRSAEAAGELAETLRTGRGTSGAPPDAGTDSSPETPAADGRRRFGRLAATGGRATADPGRRQGTNPWGTHRRRGTPDRGPTPHEGRWTAPQREDSGGQDRTSPGLVSDRPGHLGTRGGARRCGAPRPGSATSRGSGHQQRDLPFTGPVRRL